MNKIPILTLSVGFVVVSISTLYWLIKQQRVDDSVDVTVIEEGTSPKVIEAVKRLRGKKTTE